MTTASGIEKARARAAAAALGVCAALLICGVAASPAAASSASLQGTFIVYEPKGHVRPNAPCQPETPCGVGSLAEFGSATITILGDNFEDIEGSACLAVTRTSRIDLATGEGSLAVDSSGTFCQPGRSGESHAGPSSYGHPGRFSMVFTVDGTSSTGIFENASGGGTEEMSFNGGVGRWRLAGTVSLH